MFIIRKEVKKKVVIINILKHDFCLDSCDDKVGSKECRGRKRCLYFDKI